VRARSLAAALLAFASILPARAAPPDAVSHASATGPGRPAPARDTVDGAALRRRHVERLRADHAPVTVLEGTAPLELGRRICEAVVPAVPPKTPVLLKPNLGGFDWFKNPAASGGDDGVRGRITDPEFVRGVIRCLKARGLTDITVADGWTHPPADWDRLVKVSGYEAMARAEGVPLVALDDDGRFDVEGDRPAEPLRVLGMERTGVPTLLMPRLVAHTLEHGLFISLPKIKCHRFAVVSLALKGLQGLIMYEGKSPAYLQKWRTHRELAPYLEAKKKHLPEDRVAYVAALEKFAERLADVLEVEAPDVVLAEGAPAMQGDGFQLLLPTARPLAIGGTNPVLVDRVGAELLGLWDSAALAHELGGHRTSPIIEAAARRLGLDLAHVDVVGDGAAALASPPPPRFKAMAPFALGAAEEERPAIHAAALPPGATVTLDGRGDDEVWRRAPEVRFATDYKGQDTGIVTRARFLWSPDALYALFTLEGAGLRTDRSRPVDVERVDLYEEDCVELFLTPDAARPQRYFEIELGPYGHFFDLDIDKDAHRSDEKWSSGARIAAVQDEDAHRAVIEVALRAPDVTRALVAGARLRLGLYRMEGRAPRRYLAWSPPRTPRPNFHVPEAFGTLVIDPP
jgi:uncharacterized protein (DUF362 family)